MNHHGKVPASTIFHEDTYEVEVIWPLPAFRTFPIKYLILDFGISKRFSISQDISECQMQPMTVGRYTQAPEVKVVHFNPFAADVYQAGMLLYDWFHVGLLSNLNIILTSCYFRTLTRILHLISSTFFKIWHRYIRQTGHP